MAKKIYVSPSSQTANMYVTGNTTEAIQCGRIAQALVTALQRVGFEARTNTDTRKSMYDRVRESNSWGADVHIPIHTNACNGKVKGTRLFSFNKTGTGYKVCEAIMKTLAPITPGASDGISAWPGLYEVKSANAPTAYIEVGFHDNSEEAAWMINHTDDIAEAICEGLCNYYGISYKKGEVVDTYTLVEFIKDVQTICGAKVDGIAGRETLSKTITLSAKINDYHKLVKPVQMRLDALGYDVGTIDGEAGNKFTAAVKEFQADNGCVADGEITARCKTWKKLLGMA